MMEREWWAVIAVGIWSLYWLYYALTAGGG